MSDPRPASKSRLLVWTTLLIAAVVPFLPSIGGGWLGDDYFLVVEATCNRQPADIIDILLQKVGRCNYRPLRHISYALDHMVWGLEPLGYRLTNLVLHVANTALCFALLRKLNLGTLFALFGAALFAAHPVQADSVALVSGRRDLLCALGYFLAFGAALGFESARRDSAPTTTQALWVIGTLIGCIISVTSKEMGVTLAATIPLYFLLGGHRGFHDPEHAAPFSRDKLKAAAVLAIPITAPAAAIFVHRGLNRPISTMANELFGGSVTSHISTVAAVHAKYVELIFAPIRLAGDYAPPVIPVYNSPLEPAALAGLLWLVALAGALAWFVRRAWYREAFGIAWYVVALLPVSHIIPHHEILAEHYLYIPLLGVALTVAGLAERLWRRVDGSSYAGKAVVVGLCVLVVAAAVRTGLRAADYTSEKAHARATLEHYPESVRGRARLGLALLREDDFEAAKPHLQYVLGTKFQGSARLDVLLELGRWDVQQENYRRAAKLLSEYVNARPKDVEALGALSKAYFELGSFKRAASVNARLVSLNPESGEYRYKLALALWSQGAPAQAAKHARRAAHLLPDDVDAQLLAAHLLADDDPDAARGWLQRAREIIDSDDDASPQQRMLLRKIEQKLD